MKIKLLILIVLFFGYLFMSGCDPSTDLLTKGQQIDLTKIEGIVISKEMCKFEGNNDSSLAGKTYYTLTFSGKNSDGSLTYETYYDVPEAVFNSVEIGQEFSAVKSVKQLEKLNGTIIDMFVLPAEDITKIRFFIVIDTLDFNEPEIYQVNREDYYRNLKIGLSFPN